MSSSCCYVNNIHKYAGCVKTIQGPQGPQGVTGATGIGYTGPTGVGFTGPTGPSGGGGINFTTVNVSSSDILTLYTTPITLVPAQGANTIIIPIKISATFIPNTTVYTNAGPGFGVINYGFDTTDMGFYTGIISDINGIIGANTTTFGSSELNIAFNSSLDTTSILVNKDLFLFADSDFADGDGTLKITTVWYSVSL